MEKKVVRVRVVTEDTANIKERKNEIKEKDEKEKKKEKPEYELLDFTIPFLLITGTLVADEKLLPLFLFIDLFAVLITDKRKTLILVIIIYDLLIDVKLYFDNKNKEHK